MIEIIQGSTFRRWVRRLRDRRTVARINARLRNASFGHLGDTRSVGGGIFEMRIHYGPGYRLYYIREGQTVIVLLCGGVKDSQTRDIERARHLAQEWR
ncbi:MAG: type II toxin-antitoxin system RelE/ParE family toxin [Dehalococcoidia bacterium]|nr:type II toxin-antitoxin system RelE/ParE family toxin [Dehalococcoidia bacterium]